MVGVKRTRADVGHEAARDPSSVLQAVKLRLVLRAGARDSASLRAVGLRRGGSLRGRKSARCRMWRNVGGTAMLEAGVTEWAAKRSYRTQRGGLDLLRVACSLPRTLLLRKRCSPRPFSGGAEDRRAFESWRWWSALRSVDVVNLAHRVGRAPRGDERPRSAQKRLEIYSHGIM